MLKIELLRDRLATSTTVGRDLRVLASVPSTNSVLRELARAGAGEGSVVIADEQTAGHGRPHKTWYSPPGVNLYASILFRPPIPAREVNLNVTSAALRAALGDAARAAGSLAEAAGRPIDRSVFAANFLGFLDRWARTYTEQGPAPVLEAWRDRDILTGRRVEVRGTGAPLEGRVLGVDREGYLVLRDPRGLRRRVLAGEVRVAD